MLFCFLLRFVSKKGHEKKKLSVRNGIVMVK